MMVLRERFPRRRRVAVTADEMRAFWSRMRRQRTADLRDNHSLLAVAPPLAGRLKAKVRNGSQP